MRALHNTLDMPEYALIVLNISRVLNMYRLWIWQGSEYVLSTTLREVTLEVNEYLLWYGRIQNLVKDLR